MIEDFVADLKAIPLVASFTGGRVFPMVSRKGYGKQFITFTPISVSQPLQFSSLGLTTQTIQVDIYSDGFGANHEVAKVVRARYHGFNGVLNTQTIAMAEVVGERDFIDSVDDTLYRHSMDIQFTF